MADWFECVCVALNKVGDAAAFVRVNRGARAIKARALVDIVVVCASALAQ